MRPLVAAAFLTAATVTGTLRLAAQSVPLDSIQRAIDAGAYWHASQLAAPHLRGSNGGSPEARLTAARAAAGWGGWSTVKRLLDGQPWLGGRADHLGHRLLAEAALAENRTADALRHARASLPATVLPRSNAESARRWVLLARAHERGSTWDSAAVAYTRSAALAPELGGWLALRAAAVTRDPAVRQRLYATATGAAQKRVGWTEAAALARFDDRAGAAREYRKVGAVATALRLSYEVERAPAARSRIAEELLGIIRRGSPASEARQAIEIIAGYSIPVARSESLTVARQASALGVAARSNEWYAALARGGGISTADRMAWGDAEAALGRWGAAAITYRKITSGREAGRAAYLAARADLRGGKSAAAITQLNRIPTRFPNDTFAASTALYLLGDLALDAGRPDSTRALFRKLVSNYPTSEYAERAALLAPLIAYGRGSYAVARDELQEAIASRALVGFAADAGRYWLARSVAALGDSELAQAHYRELIKRGPENYYAVRSAARMGVSPWPVTPVGIRSPGKPPEEITRAQRLSELGLDTEAGHELDALVESATTPDQMIEAGRALLAAGHPARATRIGQRAIAAGAPRDVSTWELVYPLPFEPALLASSRSAELDPWLVAALIRQESGFEPRATSAVGARGLMQMMPANGPSLARTIGLADYDHAMLWQPNVNLAMGTRHFAEALRRYPDLERALAAYNAGGSRVARWTETRLDNSATLDPELFVERIPYLETRGYVRNIVVNREMYRLTHGK